MDKNYIEKMALMLTNVLDKMARDKRIHTFESIFNDNGNTFEFGICFEDISYCGYINESGEIEYCTIEDEPKDFMPRYDKDYNDLLRDKN